MSFFVSQNHYKHGLMTMLSATKMPPTNPSIGYAYQ